MSVAGAPSGRKGHAEAWNGDELIVWGGTGEGGLRDDGGRYTPADDRWRPMSLAGAPSGRSSPSVTWTGTALFIWSGQPEASGKPEARRPAFEDGALYDPESDSWSPIGTDGAPAARAGAPAVWTGTEVVVWGGIDHDDQGEAVRLSSGARYDPAQDRWTAISEEGAPRDADRPYAIWTGHAMLILDWISLPPARVGALYDPAEDSWAPVSSLGMPEGDVCEPVWTGTELFVFDKESPSASRYDPARDEWDQLDIPETLCRSQKVWTSELFIAWGPGSSPPGPRARLDIRAGVVSPMNTVGEPTPRTSHTALWTGRQMLVWGGDADGVDFPVNTGGLYTP